MNKDYVSWWSIWCSGFAVFYSSWLFMVKVDRNFGFIFSLCRRFIGVVSVLVMAVGVSLCIVIFWLFGMIFVYGLCAVSSFFMVGIDIFFFNLIVNVWLWQCNVLICIYKLFIGIMEDVLRILLVFVCFFYFLRFWLLLSCLLIYGIRLFVSGMLKLFIGSLLLWVKVVILCLILRIAEDGVVSLFVIWLYRWFIWVNNLCICCVLLLEAVW